MLVNNSNNITQHEHIDKGATNKNDHAASHLRDTCTYGMSNLREAQ